MLASGTSQRSVGLGSLFDSIFLETNKVNKVSKEKIFILLLLPLVFTFSIDPSHYSSRTDNDVSLFLKCVLSVASRFSSPPRKIVLYYTKYSFLRIFITPMSSFRVEFISNFTLIPQVENRCTQFKSDVSGAISFSGRKYTARVNAFNNSLD